LTVRAVLVVCTYRKCASGYLRAVAPIEWGKQVFSAQVVCGPEITSMLLLLIMYCSKMRAERA